MVDIQGPAPRPCESCPYRRDAPSGIWAAKEYEKLKSYDLDTPYQNPKMFQCHQHDEDTGKQLPRVCAGWCGTHDMDNNLALRLASFRGDISPEDAQRIVDYVSPVPLFSSGAEAAEHGMREIEDPSEEASRIRRKIIKLRSDIEFG